MKFLIFVMVSIWLRCMTEMHANVIRDDLEVMNRELEQRSEAEWTRLWHSERFNKCRNDLFQHMFWACNKDIYKLIRRRDNPAVGEELREDEKYETNVQFPWIRATHARRFVRWRRRGTGRRKRSITAECCDPRGCTWEEYAEYCPSKRQIH